MSAEVAWAILGLPVLTFVINSLLLRRAPVAAGWIGVIGVGTAAILSWLTFFTVAANPAFHVGSRIGWITMLDRQVQIGITIDGLTAVMLVVVTTVSLLVHLFSMGYLRERAHDAAGRLIEVLDPGYARYFAFLSLFTASMLTLVLADNLILLFIGWEMVGVCSFLLIGHWFDRPAAARSAVLDTLAIDARPSPASAAKKAFLVTRLADVPFLIAVVWFYNAGGGTTNLDTLFDLTKAGTIGGIGLVLATLGLFSGAIGKSAQFPLHVWLPDAMEGPTPVSALIHAATMVAAGVYLIGRLYPLFEAARLPIGGTDVQVSLQVIAWIGAITAFVAATMGLVAFNIKRVLAYSTISQLGYMMLGLGIGGPGAALFHLFNHAFFKALLFLGSGSVIHGAQTQDMREMGGLRKFMPVTFWTYLIGSASLAGVPFLSGFWSKDEILGDALAHGQIVLYLIGLATAFLTAFYTFRMVFLTFLGAYRGPAVAAGGYGPPQIWRGEGAAGGFGPPQPPQIWGGVDTGGAGVRQPGAGPGTPSVATTPHGIEAPAESGAFPAAARTAATTGATGPAHDPRVHAHLPPTTSGHAQAHPSPSDLGDTHAHPSPPELGGAGGGPHPHESPAIMLIPLIVLAVPAVLSGYLNVFPHGWLSHLMHFESGALNPLLLIVAAVVALAGIGLAYLMYGPRPAVGARLIAPTPVGAAFRRVGLYQLVSHKYFLDDLYNLFVLAIVLGVAYLSEWFDNKVVDGLVNGAARLAGTVGWGFRQIETGRVQAYALTIFAGVVILTGAIFLFRLT